MHITVSVTIDLPATAVIDSTELEILAAGRHAMRQALHAAAQVTQSHIRACPTCASSSLHADGTDQRVVRTSFGRVVLPVLRKRCASCGLRFRASSAFLAPLGTDSVTPELARIAADAGSSWPYATAAHWLRDTVGADISPESVRHYTNRSGVSTAHHQQQEAQHLVETTASDIRAAREAELAAPLGVAQSPAAQVLVELDGGWIASRDTRHGMEGKVSVVATGSHRLGQDRQLLFPRRYAATFGSAEQLGTLTYAAATLLNATESPKQVVLGDGATWIKTQAAWQFPDAVKILDWPHLQRAVHKAIRAARPGRKEKEERGRLYEEVGGALWEGNVDEALKVLASVEGTDGGGRHKRIEEVMEYVRGQGEWIGNYGAWQAAGYPIGSGAVEREVEIVLNRRMKKQGMRWKRRNADAVVALRVERLNQTWEQVAASQKLAA